MTLDDSAVCLFVVVFCVCLDFVHLSCSIK